MSLAAHQLDAFHAIAETGRFSLAAKRLGVTQPALSQRIQQLEAELKRRLLIRGSTGVTLTDAGTRLLRYCQAKRALESEVLGDLAVDQHSSSTSELSGTVRIAAFSSVARSCVLPALAETCRSNPELTVEFAVREMRELEALLSQGSADLVVLDHVVSRPDVEHVVLGSEEMLLVESKRHRARDDVYLDHDPDDKTTLRYLARNGVKTRHVRRSFVDDIYGVLDGTAMGLGRSVVPRHLLASSYAEELRVVGNMRPVRSPVVLHYFHQPSYTRAEEALRSALVTGVAAALGAKVSRQRKGTTT
ncbi:MAG TPA: LysR family transcriptional regulator [Labilithrix sp.]|nr:LysR family transcriptional regulator [Labilithrix sp.]